MNLQEVTQTLHRLNVEIALDIGVHRDCTIDSNCPVAVDLRRIIREAGITLPQLMEGLDQTEPTPPTVQMPAIDGRISVQIGNQSLPFDLTEYVRDCIQYQLRGKNINLDNYGKKLQDLGTGLYTAALAQIAEAKKTRFLPQLEFSLSELIKYRCMVTSDHESYLFLFPIEYKPQWLVTRENRYEIQVQDVLAMNRELLVVYGISRDRKFALRPYLLDKQGAKFQHYHGRGGDCWGHMRLPELWDGTLKSLGNLSYQLQASLATINLDSLMQRDPPALPDIDELRTRARLLGVEGRIETRVVEATQAQTAPEQVPRAWGRRT